MHKRGSPTILSCLQLPVIMKRLKNANNASFEENTKGSLKVGKLADMIVLSKDLFTIKPKEILTTKVLYTILGGKIVYPLLQPERNQAHRTERKLRNI